MFARSNSIRLTTAFLCCGVIISFLTAQRAQAAGEKPPAVVEAVHAPEFPLRVDVRTIRADGMIPESGEAKEALDIDADVRDVSSQLERLHYTHFHMVNKQSVVLPPRKRRKLELVDGHQIVLRPIAVDGENICLWLKWKDKTGTVLLDTRLRFVAGESMLTGTDHMPDAGIILAIRVEPVIP